MNILKENDLGDKLKNLFRNFSLMIGCYFLFFMLLGFLNTYFPEIDMERYQQSDLFEMLKENPLKFIFLAAVAAPIIEESIFRSLLKPSAASLKLFICAILYFIGIIILSDIAEESHWLLRYSLLFLTLFLCYYAMGKLIPEAIFRKSCNWLQRFYLPIWILGAIIFGFVHIFNYVESFQIDMILIILIFPRIIAGFFFGKIKIENKSMIWPVLMHSMNNSIVLLVVLPGIL